MPNQLPYQILMVPFEVWIAPVGTAYPAPNIYGLAIPTPWTRFGTSGTEDMDDSGVEVAFTQKFGEFRGAGSTGIRKVTRTTEDMLIRFKLADVTLYQFRHALNENPMQITPASVGIPATEVVKLYQGVDVNNVALMIRGFSPRSGDANGFRQYQVPNCWQSGQPKMNHTKGKAADIDFEFTALADPFSATAADRFGKIVDYTSAAL